MNGEVDGNIDQYWSGSVIAGAGGYVDGNVRERAAGHVGGNGREAGAGDLLICATARISGDGSESGPVRIVRH